MTRTSYIIYPVLSAAAWPPSCWTTARNTPSRTVDFKRIALWMGGCDKHKHWKSKQPGPVEMIPRFRLIDVMNMRLVCAPHIARYAALSYVWGKCKQFLLTQDRVEELETPHSLNKHAHELSKVITDALHSCRCLGIPYLWVDSLCIVQDDANAKHAQIARMDIIYSGAYVTFAAAGGNDADAGLQRVSAPMQTEQQQRILIDKQEYMVARSATCLVDKSPWRRRAWTFQELVLSRRIIFFTEQETILMCESEMLLESKLYARSEKASSLFETGRMMRYLSTPYDFVDANLTVIGAMVKDYKTSWLQLLNEYLGRDLSYDDDIEFAYTGILSAKEAHMGSYHHGLPVQILARALCWFSAHLKTRRPGFPSWSWSGWKFAQSATGPISNQIPPLDPLSSETYSLVVYVRLYGFDGMGHLKLLLGDRDEESGVEGFWGFDQHYPSAPTTEGNNGRNWALFDQFIPPQETPHVSLPEPCPVPRSQLLVFWASCAKFKVSFDEIPMTFDDGPFSTYKVDIDDVGSTRVFVDPGWRAQQPEKLECVAIVGDEISVHAILIQWKNGVAYRVGTVSPILKQEWLTREPERKLVVLG
ncbi:HET-domain-containing protein [Polyplosphaeria fusca]|uniref:HET-domain-containing protein n=1 Tax=Polyplosphaeria fusca TaxID=682080 RepID=A0A9P4QMQ9_9PLEO|nr:HET-domain-containing protein [Polyplosphaeria fusca]